MREYLQYSSISPKLQFLLKFFSFDFGFLQFSYMIYLGIDSILFCILWDFWIYNLVSITINKVLNQY